MLLHVVVSLFLALLFGAVLLLLIPSWRQALITRPAFRTYKRILPQMSETERDALEAGTVWWEGELFRGDPDWQRLLDFPVPKLTPEEEAFMANEVEAVCALVDDWEVTTERHDLSPAAWQYIKAHGFLGMIIPKAYGGLGFSAYAHSQVVTKLSTRSSALAVTVMVPNSLGPAELLLHYGTEAQKQHYLPRLAKGLDIPAFALTSPWAGSDAASIPDYGVVCTGMWSGQEVLGMRVTWEKRYATLAPVCTVLGLAFRLYDPDGLLGGKQDLGITCALVPRDTPGAEFGRRHYPLDAMFMNGPTRGREVFMPLDFIIGGPKMAGKGWRMLMECLAAGRSISLPASHTGMAQLTARAVGGYARVRSQFKMAVGRFEGVEEPLTRIGAYTYMMNAVRTMTAGAVDLGEKPSVTSAIAKYHVTERGRQVVTDGMDILGGKGICLGPSNFLGRAYQQLPIGITVEGANILTRTMILFGQGAIRCHPYVFKEMLAAQNPDPEVGLREFDQAITGHTLFTLKHGLRAVFRGLTGSHFIVVPADIAPETRRYYQQISRFSTAFAFLADISMLVMGGSLKRREKISARLGDILALMYLCSATLKRYEAEGRQAEDAPLMHWAIWDAMYKTQMAFDGVIANFPHRWIGRFLFRTIFPLGHPYDVPSDRIGHQVASLLIGPTRARDRLTAECYLPASLDEPVGAIEAALAATLAAEPIEARIRSAEKSGAFAGAPDANVRDIAHVALARGIVSAEEYALLAKRNALRDRVIQVDEFDFALRQRCSAAPAGMAAVADDDARATQRTQD